MSPKSRRTAAIAAACLVVAAGGGFAVAATNDASPADEQKALLDDAAKRLEVSPERLTTALREAFLARLDAAVAAGRLPREHADRIRDHVRKSGVLPPLGLVGPGPHFRHVRIVGGFEAAAKYLGLTAAQLHEELSEGRSLADVAKARDKSVEGLKAAMRADMRSDLEADVAAKRLRRAWADRMLRGLDERLDAMIARKHPEGARPFGLLAVPGRPHPRPGAPERAWSVPAPPPGEGEREGEFEVAPAPAPAPGSEDDVVFRAPEESAGA